MTMVGMESKPASCLYMQLSQDHRVSRSFRATWFLKSLTHCMEPCTPPLDPSSVDISMLSAVGGNQLVPGTEVFYVCQQHSLVFVLDMSPTMMTASNTTYKVKVDEAMASLYGCLRSLARPFQVPGSSVTLEPQLCVTVLAYCGSAANKPIHVLLQGVDLHCGNMEGLTELLKNSIRDYEISLSQDGKKSRPLHYSSYADHHSKGDNSLEGMVKAGALALQLLPRNCLKGLILLTDGICGFSSPNLLHNSASMIRGHNISCWVVQVGGPPDPTAAFGLLPDTETLNFITMACNGCVMAPEKIQQTVEGLCEDSLSVNAVQKAILFWTFQRGAHSERIREVMCEQYQDGEDYFAPIVGHGFQKYTINAPLLCVTGCRIREGFLLKDVCLRDTTLEVYLYYPWQPSVTIYYTITAPWPVTNESATLEVTISYDGPYFFVDDVNRDLNPSTDSQYRVTAARKFKQALKTYSNSDTLLAHLLSFSATPTYYTLPQTLQDGMPLFYLQPNQTKPVPSVGLSTSGEKRPRESPLITFWRPLCTIDTNLWYRWFHSDKIILVLQQDSYLPRNLLAPSSNGRFASIQCRLAASRLFAFLKSWSSFILLENHSFIRFLPSNESPKYFCFIRVAQKHPCVVLHVGHIEGTPHVLQSKTMQSLYCALRGLGGSEKTTGHGYKRRSKVAQQAKTCATVIDKQLQRVMIRYDNLSSLLATQSLSLAGGGEGERQLQMDYLSCTHWQWRVPHCGPAIPSALLRHRLKEGFHLTSAHNGVVTLAVQLTMQQSSSLQMLLQYVIFPADENLKSVTTELWVEPQYGHVLEAPPGLHYLKRLQHSQITDKFQAEDEKLVAAMSSFLFLRHCCERRLPQLSLDEGEEEREMVGIEVRPAVKSCKTPFQLSSLLDKSRVLGFTLTTFSEVNTAATLNLSSCSLLNRNFREQFLQQLRSVAPTEVSVTDFQPLLCRLLASEYLAELCRVCYLEEDSTRRGWKCFAQSQQDSLFMFLVPAYFSLHPDAGEREDDLDSQQAFSLPVILLCCNQQILMDPDPAHPAPPILQPDVYQHLSLSPPPQQATSSGGSFQQDSLSQLVSKLRVIHFSSYLHTMHATLLSRAQLTQKDFLSALTVCRQTSISVDLTPLIAALCPHASAHLPPTIGEEYQKYAPLSTQMLCHLIEALLSRRHSSCLVHHNPKEPSSVPHCTLWKSEVDQSFSSYLAELGFAGVPECGGYYWLNTVQEREHPKSVPSPELFPDIDLPNSDHDDEEGAPGSPSSEPSTLHKFSVTEDYDGNTDISTEIPDRASQTPSSEGDLALSPLLSALSLPDKLGTPAGLHEDSQWMVAPLFLKIVCTVTNHETQESNSAAVILPSPGLPVCLKSVLSDTFQAGSYSVSLDLVFYSFSPEPQSQPAVQEDISDGESFFPLGEVAPPGLPAVYHSIAHSLKHKTEWLIRDELISVSRNATPITAPLLQAVATHVQTSKTESCLIHHVPLKFVFGVSHSMSHFILLLESVECPALSIVKVEDYYYLTPRLRPSHSLEDTLELEQQESPVELIQKRRNSVSPNLPLTPPSPSSISKSRSHRRSVSLGFLRGHTPTSLGHTPTPPPGLNSYDSVSSIEENGYDASRSCSLSSLSGRLAASLDSDHQEASQLWLVLRVLEHQVDVYFQTRSSQQEVGSQLQRFQLLCNHVVEEIQQTCHKTNQWYLLKDMLDTRMCSPLLLPESAPDAWVDKIQLPGGRESGQGGEGFQPQEFQCKLQWKRHITPHWRLKTVKTQAALRITRTALSAFAVSNRMDVYVLQDVKETGEETIFYLKIDESLCRVEDNVGELEESLFGEGLDRCETKVAIEATESLSSYSYSIQQSISEIPDLDSRGISSSMDTPTSQPGRPQESLVLQLYGIAKPSLSLLHRLSFIISMKLDDATLEMMCGLYTRNQKLRLHPVDVQFLQPSQYEASHVLTIPIPSWIRVPEVEAFTFYFLQALSSMALRPKYTSSDTRDQFCVAQPLHDAYMATGLPQGLHQDHLFLYIRPHTQGRGMAVICASLVNPHGHTMVPQPGVVSPATGSCPLDLQHQEAVEEAMQCQIQELSETHPLTGSYSFCLHIWEKGNVGMADLSTKLTSCFKHAMSDYLLELCLLPLPIARQPEGSFVWDSATNSPNMFLENEGPGNKGEKKEVCEAGSQKTSSDKGEVYKAGSRKTSSEKGEVYKAGSRKTSSEQILARMVPNTSTGSVDSSSLKSDAPVRSRVDTEKIVEDISDALLSENGGLQEGSTESSLTWHGKEWLRREQEARDKYYQEAHFGRSGILDETYHTTIPQHLARACKLASPSVSHSMYTFMGSHSARTFLTEAIASIQQLCPDLNLSAFERYLPGEVPPGQYAHCTPERDWSKVERVVELSDLHYIVIGRNLQQWEECCDPMDPSHRSTHPWVDLQTKQSLQLFYPLDSKKFVRGVEVPLQQSVVGGEAFVPRQRLVLMSITSCQAQLWLYNLSEELMSRVRHQLNVLGEWQQMRVGLLHHILAQKMGLFQHTHARDIQNCTKMASKHCSSIQVVSNVVKSASPIANEPTPIRSPHRPHVIGTVAIETFYQEMPPRTRTPHSADPVYNHGQQLRDSHTYQRRQYESQELLGKVFTSWQSRKGGESAPVNSATIDNLKRRARLLHYCTSPLLLQQSLLFPTDTQGQDRPSPWFDAVREEVLSLYIQYLQSLGFQTINERPPTVTSRQKAGSRTPSRVTLPLPSQRLYKCLQRSWPGGIILTELLLRGDKFHVKLYTLENSRLINQTTLSPEVHSLFSMECARYKDFIHVHSFMHDFHLRFLLSLLSGTRQPPENFDIRRLLQLFRHHNKVPPNFIRSRLCKDSICVPVTVDPSDLYHYIVAHCGVFGMETFEMCPGASRSRHEDICLLIDVSPHSLGPTTTPQLSRLLQDFQESYSIRILTVYKQQPVEDRPCHLKLSFFLLLVNKSDFFPRLTCDSPHLSATHHPPTPTTTLGPLEQKRDESELNFNVRKHRRKLGFGSLTSPSGPSQVVLDVAVMEEQLRGLREHLQDVVKSAQCNMRRDELWKRVLYGKQKTDTKPSSVHFESLSCTEFQELLRLVTVCHLDSLDARLSPLRRQTKKWYRKFMVSLAIKFADTIRLYSSEGDSYKFAVIVNPEWQDMFVLVQSDRDGRHQGFSAVYRKPREGGVPLEERPITAHIEADRSHMETVVNFACSYLWASILDTSPPQPHLNLL